MNDIATIGHNQPPPFERLSLRLDELQKGAKGVVTGQPALITDLEVGEKLGGFLKQLKAALKEAEEEKATEKQPHWDACVAVEAKWAPLIKPKVGGFAITIDFIAKKVDAFLAEQNRLRRVAEDAARKEAARLAQVAIDAQAEADRLKAAADAGTLKGKEADPIQAQIDAEEATKTAKVAVKEANSLKGNVTAGSSYTIDGAARGVGQRTTYHARIEKPTAALAYFSKNEKLLEVLQGLCNAHIRDREGNPTREPPPGCSVYTTTSAS